MKEANLLVERMPGNGKWNKTFISLFVFAECFGTQSGRNGRKRVRAVLNDTLNMKIMIFFGFGLSAASVHRPCVTRGASYVVARASDNIVAMILIFIPFWAHIIRCVCARVSPAYVRPVKFKYFIEYITDVRSAVQTHGIQ